MLKRESKFGNLCRYQWSLTSIERYQLLIIFTLFRFLPIIKFNKCFYTFQEYEYKMSREYNWNVKSKASKGYEENYFFILREDGFYYDELETR